MTNKEVAQSIVDVLTLEAIHNTFDVIDETKSTIIKHKAGIILEIDDVSFLVSNGGVSRFVDEYLEIQAKETLTKEELDAVVLGYIQANLARFILGEEVAVMPGFVHIQR